MGRASARRLWTASSAVEDGGNRQVSDSATGVVAAGVSAVTCGV